jgi:hypothetical protein
MYSITIKTEGIERRRKSIGILHIIAGFFLLLNAGEYSRQMNYQTFWPVLPFYFTALVSLGYGVFRKRLDPAARFNHWVRMLQVLVFISLAVLMMNKTTEFRILSLFLWAAVCMMLLFSERKAFHHSSLFFGKDQISIPGHFSDKIVLWEEVEEVVLRPDYVTICFPENKYSQYEVLNEVSQPELEKINSFCREKIKEHQTKDINVVQ